jgi:hypothetical protein
MFVSVLSAGRRARAWRTNMENIVEGAAALGWKKTEPRDDFDETANSGTNTSHYFVCCHLTKFIYVLNVVGSGSLTRCSRNPSALLSIRRSLGGDQVSRRTRSVHGPGANKTTATQAVYPLGLSSA